VLCYVVLCCVMLCCVVRGGMCDVYAASCVQVYIDNLNCEDDDVVRHASLTD
jgi:hypothetical protein